MITENSGLLENLLPGDTVLLIVALTLLNLLVYAVSVLLFRPQQQERNSFLVLKWKQTRRVANVRRAYNCHQKYTFLSATQPIDFLTQREDGIPLLNKVVFVCCALISVNQLSLLSKM